MGSLSSSLSLCRVLAGVLVLAWRENEAIGGARQGQLDASPSMHAWRSTRAATPQQWRQTGLQLPVQGRIGARGKEERKRSVRRRSEQQLDDKKASCISAGGHGTELQFLLGALVALHCHALACWPTIIYAYADVPVTCLSVSLPLFSVCGYLHAEISLHDRGHIRVTAAQACQTVV
jgi:hypothetical protein